MREALRSASMVRALLLGSVLLLASCAEPSPAPVAAPPAPAPPAAVVSTAPPPPAIAIVPPTSAAPAPSAAPTAKAAPGSFQQISLADERRLVTPHLAGKKLAHPAFRGPFGPPGDSIVALTATADGPAELTGFVVLADGRVLPLPKLHDHWTLWETHAVMFEDFDSDGAKDLIVIAEYTTGAGPQAAVPFFASAAVRWDGQAFVRVPAVEKKIELLGDAAAIRKALRGLPRGRSR